jgi:2-oxoglutarate ferredoxin oxidoreductase subunit delta
MDIKKKNKEIVLDINRCKGCEVCVISCPNNCLIMSSDDNNLGNKFITFQDKSKCVVCGICSTVCPEFYAISIK